MDEEYDVIVLGTGLKECVISGLLSIGQKKVLHMDRQKYYGGESASLCPLKMLFQVHGKEGDHVEGECGRDRDWNVDLIPKLIMANGELVKMLIKSGVTKYLEFKSIEGSYVYYKKKLIKIPATHTEAITSELVNLFSKKKFAEFVKSVSESEDDGTISKKGYIKGMTTEALFKMSKVSDVSDVIGHAIALQIDDNYLQEPCEETIKRLRLYFESVSRYGKSPYLYPMFGLGELPQGFARLSALYGGTYMLEKPIDEIVMEDGKVVGVKSEGETARCKMVVGDPSYFPNLVKKVGRVVRIICILEHPVMNASSQIIFPCSQVPGRKSDIYVCCVSYAHRVAPDGYYIAIAACKVETDQPERELDIALGYLEPIKKKFVSVSDLYEPINDGTENNVFITTSYDATTHFETSCRDIKDVIQRITGQPADFSKVQLDTSCVAE